LIWYVQIPGLCIGRGGVSVDSSQQVGYLFLMRNMEGAKKLASGTTRRIFLYLESACSVSITTTIIATETTISDAVTAVAWCDGDMSQINAIKHSVDLYVKNKIIANKQNAA
jgi:hypothetical protein